jgi:phytoene dehydrogenase-like protein
MDVGVVGAGLAGLVTAKRLAAADHDVTVFEARESVGGRVTSVERDGYTFDRGFQVLFTAYPAAQRELDYDRLDLRRFRPGAIVCRPDHRAIVSDPFRDPRAAVETALTRDLTMGDKLRVLRLRLQLRTTSVDAVFDAEDETIEAYLRRRGFSQRFRRNFARPFYGGITLDPSLQTSKRVFEFTFKMLSTGAIAVPAAGMGAIADQLADQVRTAGGQIETGSEVLGVTGGAGGATLTVAGESHEVDAAVVATDPATARRLTDIESIPTETKGCVTQYYRLGSSELGTGKRLLLNATADGGPNEIVPVTEVAPEYAPDDETVISATYLGVPSDDDRTLTERTRETLAAWYPERSIDRLECVHTDRIPNAQFAQPPGIHETLPGPRDPEGAVYLAGEYTRDSSINGALLSGRDAASAVDAGGA